VENLKTELEGLTKKYNVKPVAVIQPIRVALCGKTVSPGIFDVIAILGKETVERRLRKAIESIQ
jgi:glutamyl-tRNA synthetase